MAYELTYKLINNDTKYELTGYTGTPDVVDIPRTYNGKFVTTIGSSAFKDCTSLTSVTIPNSVTTIGKDAFRWCESLNAVYTTDLATWCNTSFGNSYANPLFYAKNLYLNGQLVTELVIPEGVTSIGDYAFRSCTSLKSVTIPDSVKSIGEEAFDSCDSLMNIVIPDNVINIGSSAFYHCDSLTNVVIGDSVTSISSSAFRECASLTSVSIGNSVTSIGVQAFYYCTSLKRVTIPDSVTAIDSSAFYDCKSLTSITLLNTIPPAVSFNSFNDISEDAKFYCFPSCLDAYKTATNWNKHADKFTTIKADIKLCFTMNAKAQKKYFASKDELKRIDDALKNCAEKDTNGNITVSTPTEANHAATKAYVDNLIKSALSKSY